MDLPADWQTKKRSLPDAGDKDYLGHEDQGGTIALHSLAVKAEHQRKQVGSTLLRSYINRIKEAAIADRIALLAHEHMIPFYQRFGFENYGPSACKFGGGGWYDMVSWLLFPHLCRRCKLTNIKQVLEFDKYPSIE